jgi:hypothetical protein
MSALFASGRIIDAVLVLTLLEVVALLAFRRVTGRGPRLSAFLLNVLSGLCLMLAVRAALVGAFWGIVSLWMLAALLLHLADLARIWRD